MTQTTLPDLVQELGFKLRKQGRSWGGPVCPSCGESSPGSNKLSVFVRMDGKWGWKCQACSQRGDAADFLSKAKGITLGEALRELREKIGITAKPEPAQHDARALHVRAVVQALHQHGFEDTFDVKKYLEGRGISEDVVDAAYERGLIRSLPTVGWAAKDFLYKYAGEDDLRGGGFIKGDKAWPAIAFRPLVGVLPGQSGAEFRMITEVGEGDVKAIRYGRLDWPWWWPHTIGERVKEVLLVEGIIDLLSVVQMGIKPGQAIMGMPGVNTWRLQWATSLAQRHPGVRIAIGLDADKAGELTSSTILKELKETGIPGTRRAPNAKDWNAMLTLNR